MSAALQQRYVLVASGRRIYTFTPDGGEVEVRFTGPRGTMRVVVPPQEARDLWRNLRKRGYERW